MYIHALHVISLHKVFKSKFWMHFLFTQVSYMSYPPHPWWVTYSNSILWTIKIIPHNVIFSNTSSLTSNLLHSTFVSRHSLVVGFPVTVYSNFLTSTCLNNGESQILLCPPPPQMVGWWLRGGIKGNMGSEPSWKPHILHIPKIILVSGKGREGMEKNLQWIWPSECYTWCHRNFNTRCIYLCPSQICFTSTT